MPVLDWKCELVASAAQADAFMRRRLRALGVSPLMIESDCKNGLRFCASTTVGGREENVVSLEIGAGRGGCVWYGLDVYDGFRGRGLALAAVKCALGVAREHVHNAISIFCAREDGPVFWAELNAVPESNPLLLRRALADKLRDCGDQVDLFGQWRLNQICDLAERNAYAAWRELSQTKIDCADGSDFKASILRDLCREQNLVLILNDAATRAGLKRKIGVLPACDATAPNGHGYILQSLAEHRRSLNRLVVPRIG